MPLIKQHFIRLCLVREKIGRSATHLFLFFFSVHTLAVHALISAAPYSRGYKEIKESSLLPENRLPTKEVGDPILVRFKETLAIDLPVFKSSAFLLNHSIVDKYPLKELILLPNNTSLNGYTLARYTSISKISTSTVKLTKYVPSKKNPPPSLSMETYPDYSPASLNWSIDYTHSFHHYQEALETKRLFRQDTKELSSWLSSFIASSTSECLEAIEWKITEGFTYQANPPSEQWNSFLVKNSPINHSFKSPKLFSIDTLSEEAPSFEKWVFITQNLQDTRSFPLFQEALQKKPAVLAAYSSSLVNSYLKESGFKPLKAYIEPESSSDINYTTALLAVQSDLSKIDINKQISLINLFPVSSQFYRSSLKKDAHLENLDKMEMTLSFLSTDFLDQELIFLNKIDFELIPILSQFPIKHKKIEKITYLSPWEFQSLSIDFILATISLKGKKISPIETIVCFLSPYKGEDILEDFAMPHPFSTSWGSFFSLHDKHLVSALQTSPKMLLSPPSFPAFQQAQNILILESSIHFVHFPNRIDKPVLKYTPLSQFQVFRENTVTHTQASFPFVTEAIIPTTIPVPPPSLWMQNALSTPYTPIEESLAAVPLLTTVSITASLNDLSIHSYSEFYIPFFDKDNEKFLSLYGAHIMTPLTTNKEDIALVSSLSVDTFVMPTKILLLRPHAIPSPSIASAEMGGAPLYSFLTNGNVSIITQRDPLGHGAYSSSLVRILPYVHLLETTPFDPLFLSGNASIEINRAHRMISFELASLPSLAELDTDSLGDDFIVEAKITPQMKETGYLFSLKLKATDGCFLPPEKHHVLFVIDRNASIEKHRYDIYKKSLLQSLTYLDSNTPFNICFFDNSSEKMSPHDLKPTKAAQLFAQKFLQNTPQVKGSSFADFIALMQEIKKIASLSTDLYSVILLSNGGSMKNIRLNRESLKELIWDWPDSLSLYTTAISDNNNLPMLELLSKIGKGELSLAKTHSAFGRKLCTLVRRVSKPIAHGIAVTALSDDPNLEIEFSNRFSGQLFADRSFTIYGKASSLCNIDLLLQGRRDNRFINLRKRISLKDAEKGKSTIEKEFYSHLAVNELIAFIFSNDQTHLLKAKKYLDPFDSSLTNQL